jgi:hypothetical protein
MNKIYFSLLLILFFSCATRSKIHHPQITYPRISYMGNSYAPTIEADIYVDERSIERPYKVVGKGYPNWGLLYSFHSLEQLQQKALETAKNKGADAVLIQDYYMPGSANVNSFFRTDSIGKGSITVGNSTLSNTSSTGFVILFLKYKDR